EAPADAGGNNVYDVTVQVADGHGGVDAQALAVGVTDVAGLTINGTSKGGTLTGRSEERHVGEESRVAGGDPDAGESLSYAISGGADAGLFTFDAASGALSFLTAPSFEAPADAGGNNVYDVTVQVADGHGGVDAQALAVGVTDVAGLTINGTSKGETLTG